MSNENYETQIMRTDQAQIFSDWFESTIGTEYEKNSIDNGFYFVCMELTNEEVHKVIAWENRHCRLIR